jgi:hypothetical protein
MTNEEVAALLNATIGEVEELADELGVPDDEWTAEDVFEADRIIDEEDDDGAEDDEPDPDDQD